jgi:hypothetical protein
MTKEIRLGPNLIANSATIVAESLKHPLQDSTVNLDTGYVEISTSPAGTLGLAIKRKKTAPRRLSEGYKIILIAVIVLTVLSLIIEICLAIWAHDPPTGFQNNLFGAADFGWKTGFGALIGLLGGKQL